MNNIKVSDVMTRNPISVGLNATLLECARKMVRKRVKSVLIEEEGILKGLVTQRDIVWAIVKNPESDLSKIKAIDISPKKLATIKPSMKIETVIRKMNSMKFYRLPVLSDRKIVGLISSTDILNFSPEVYPEFEELHRIKDEEEKLARIERAGKREIVEEGICEGCGGQGPLIRENGNLVCYSCSGSE